MSRALPVASVVAVSVGWIGAAHAAATLVNGSLTGPIDNSGVPSPWTISLNSPDTMDETHNVGLTTGVFVVTPSGPSPDGGTWVGIWGSHINGGEAFGQDVTGFTVGREYRLDWYQGNFGVDPYAQGPGAIEVLIDGTPVGTGATIPLGADWSSESVSFTATSNSHRIDFRNSVVGSYVSIDGIRLSCCNGDLDGDGFVTILDFNQFLACFQSCPPVPACLPADINCDGCIDVTDFEILSCQLELGVPDPACCEDPPPQLENQHAFCIDGPGDGSGWSWHMGSPPGIAVTGPIPPASAEDLRDAFVASFNAQSIPTLSAQAIPGTACFKIFFLGPIQLWVGPPAGPSYCLVSGNPDGCPFNPRIYDRAFFPYSIPLLSAWALVVFAALLGGVSLALARRR